MTWVLMALWLVALSAAVVMTPASAWRELLLALADCGRFVLEVLRRPVDAVRRR